MKDTSFIQCDDDANDDGDADRSIFDRSVKGTSAIPCEDDDDDDGADRGFSCT